MTLCSDKREEKWHSLDTSQELHKMILFFPMLCHKQLRMYCYLILKHELQKISVTYSCQVSATSDLCPWMSIQYARLTWVLPLQRSQEKLHNLCDLLKWLWLTISKSSQSAKYLKTQVFGGKFGFVFMIPTMPLTMLRY